MKRKQGLQSAMVRCDLLDASKPRRITVINGVDVHTQRAQLFDRSVDLFFRKGRISQLGFKNAGSLYQFLAIIWVISE